MVRLAPSLNAAMYSPSPAPPMTAAITAPRVRSLTGWLASTPIADGGSPDLAIR